MMPVRDMVIFPEMMHPFIVGREASVRALEEALAGDKKIFLVTQHDASVDDPKPEEIYQVGTLANIVQSVKLPDGNIKVLVEGTERAKIVQVTSEEGFFRATVRARSGEGRAWPADRAGLQPRHQSFRAVRKALAEPELRHDDRGGARGRSRQAVRRDRREPADSGGRKAGTARTFRSARAAEPHRGHPGSRNREAQRRSLDQYAREAADGARPKRVLPQRKAQGDPEGAGPRRSQRNRAAQEEDRDLRHARRADGKGHAGAEAAGDDAADVGRIHRFAQLSRLAAGRALEKALEGNSRYQARRADPLRRSLRPRKDQGAHSRISRRPPAREESEGLDSLLPRASGRRQDVARDVDRPRHGAQIRARFARRRARRGGNSRPSPHLHRRPARPDHPDDAQGRHDQSGVRARRSGQDVHGFPRRSVGGADGSARSGAEPRVHRPLPRRGIRSFEGDVHLHGQRAAHDSAALAGPHGSSADRRATRSRKSIRSRSAIWFRGSSKRPG